MAVVLSVSQDCLHEGDPAGCPDEWLATRDAVMTHEPGTSYNGSMSGVVCHVYPACCLWEAIDAMDTTQQWSNPTDA